MSTSVLSRLAMCLVEANGDSSSPACNIMEEILEELTTFFCYLGASHPQKMLTFKSLKLEGSPSSLSTAPPEELWQNIAAAANFTEQQVAQITGTTDYLLTKLDKVMQERKDISAQLTAAARPEGCGAVTMGLSTQAATGHIQALQATEKLHQNLHEAQDCLTQFQIAARDCMTSLQVAMVCVQSFPWIPDLVALFSSVAKSRDAGKRDLHSSDPTVS